MYITFDYKCPTCGHVESRFVRRSEMDEQFCNQELDAGLLGLYDCRHRLIRLPAGTRTTFRFADTNLKD